jgi:signal transduction histidine kinase/CheY-like chemotaxis protein
MSDGGQVARGALDADIALQLPLRRRRFGLALLALGVLALAAQTLFAWLLPYDDAPLAAARHLTRLPGLTPAALACPWAALSGLLLARLAVQARERAEPRGWAVAAGLSLGSAYVAAGGAPASLAMLLLVGVASLGWQLPHQGGLALLLATALAVIAWDAVFSTLPLLWMAVAVMVAAFVWIDRRHIRANDRRLFAALAERDSLIRDLDARGEQLTQLQGARTQLLASISHDLRQPLQAVRLYADALQGRPDGGERWRELLRQQLRATDDAVAMLDQFSEFSAIEQGMLVSRPEVVDLRALLARVAESLQATHPREQLTIRVHGRATPVWADRSQLTRLVQNLAGNAVRYSLGVHRGRPARVVLAVRPRGGGCVIDVLDNGRGIPADQVDRVFEPYVQLPQSPGDAAARSGRGLGLAIVRGLVVQLGLTLAPVRSVPGRGTRFRVQVPSALRRNAVEAPPAAPAPGARLDGWLIALLDDEDAARMAMRAALEGVGATLIDAATLDRLKALLDDEPRFPDALVFDLDLGPGEGDGRHAVATLREAWDLRVPAVIVTGRVGAQSVILPKRCSLLAKPVPLADLVATLHRLAPRGA